MFPLSGRDVSAQRKAEKGPPRSENLFLGVNNFYIFRIISPRPYKGSRQMEWVYIDTVNESFSQLLVGFLQNKNSGGVRNGLPLTGTQPLVVTCSTRPAEFSARFIISQPKSGVKVNYIRHSSQLIPYEASFGVKSHEKQHWLIFNKLRFDP